jgi:hypothetical protein
MLRTSFLVLGATALLSPAALAQSCFFNVHPVTMVKADGTPAPVFMGQWEPYAQFTEEAVYMAFDSTTPSGTYYVHVTDVIGDPSNDIVLSANDPMDRFVAVTNTNGVITLSLPYTNNPNPAQFGLGLNGQGHSLALFPFASAAHAPCEFAVQVGESWDLQFGPEWPYAVRGGYNEALQRCNVQSYALFNIGNGTGSDVSGRIVRDADRDGAIDASETGVAGFTVRLLGDNTARTTVTDAAGNYTFAGVGAGNWSIEVVTGSAWVATGDSNKGISLCGCGDLGGQDFPVAEALLTCEPRPLCWWVSSAGRQRVQQIGVLSTLPGLYLRDLIGRHVAPGTSTALALYLALANTNSINMAWRLSAEVAVMQCNLTAGFVNPLCVVSDPVLGQLTVAELMTRAVGSLSAHPLTLWCSQHRTPQMRLKNALQNANENRNWL